MDTITDFTQGQDQIELDNLFDGPNDVRFQQLLADLHNAANGESVIHLDGGAQTITLTGQGFTNSTFVLFPAEDASGTTGQVVRTGIAGWILPDSRTC